ncbi:MAG: hemoglobin [Chitinophagaceae bacterium]|nr:MAG: hemoglobin [Chitinophagaceae bacterium]
MTQQQITLVQNSWGLVSTIDQVTVGSIFYTRLFETMPEVRPMFIRSSIPEQSKKLMTMLSYVITRLDRLDNIIEEVRKMARRHTHYGVQDHHYDAVGNALLFTLQKGLGNEWNPDLSEAWTSIYQALANAMMTAQHDGQEPAQEKRA